MHVIARYVQHGIARYVHELGWLSLEQFQTEPNNTWGRNSTPTLLNLTLTQGSRVS